MFRKELANNQYVQSIGLKLDARKGEIIVIRVYDNLPRSESIMIKNLIKEIDNSAKLEYVKHVTFLSDSHF